MHILVITGSPHKRGTSALLVDAFLEGATAAGHQVERFDSAFAAVAPCRACDFCRSHGEQCTQKDDMEALWPKLLQADLVVLATPLYYFGFSAQLKAVLDRFYAKNASLRQHPKGVCLLATCGDSETWAMDGLRTHYACFCKYMGWEDRGQVLAFGVSVPKDIEATDYPAQARALGASL